MKTGTIVGIVVILAIIGGAILFAVHNANQTSYTATSTPISDTTQNTSQTTTQTQAGAANVVTSSTAHPTDTTVIVSGQVTPNGAMTSYWYEYGTTIDLGSKTNTQIIGSGFASISAPVYITGLSKDTTYYFRLVAENSYGRTDGSQYSFHTTVGTPPPVGSAPKTTTLSANSISRTTANLNGEVTPNQAVTQYWFEYGKTTSLGNTSAFVSVGDGTSKVPASLSLSDLDPATTYYFRLNAQNQFGTINGSILNFKTSGPPISIIPVVTTQVASPTATTTATLRGTVNPNGTQTTYWFEYSTDSLLGSLLLKTTPQHSAGAGNTTVSVQANISGLQSETNYYYRMVAQNTAGTVRGDNQTFVTK